MPLYLVEKHNYDVFVALVEADIPEKARSKALDELDDDDWVMDGAVSWGECKVREATAEDIKEMKE